jgi:hypothetical protein
MVNAQPKESIRALARLEHEQITETAFAEASRRSDDARLWWAQAAWQGGGSRRRCWRWDGWICGRKSISIVWIKGRGYCVRDVIQNRQVGQFETLAHAQEEATVAVTALPFAVCDLFAEVSQSMAAWRAVHEPIAAAVAGGVYSLGRWGQEVKAAESRKVLELARSQLETFNLMFSSAARFRAKAA